MNLLVERKFHRVLGRLEFRFRCIDRRNHNSPAGIDHIFDKPQRVTFLFLGLLKKMLRQLRQRLRREMRRDRVILQLRAELVSYLLVNRVDDFLAGKHVKTLPRIARMQTDRIRGEEPAKKKPSTLTGKVLGSGDVLLSHGLSPYYHRGCSVSLPCSEWERVGPLRYCHQSAEPDGHLEPHERFHCCRSDASADAGLWRRCRSVKELWFSDIYIQE